MKIVVNRCFGGFGLSEEAIDLYMKYKKINEICVDDIPRNDPILVKVVRKLGDEANGSCAALEIVTIPDDIQWVIQNHDGMETVAEKHRVW